MKTLWNILCVLAIANLLGIVGFVGWLAASDRLSMDRGRAIRAVLAPTLTQEAAQRTEAEAAQVAEAAKAKEAARFAGTPESAAEQLDRNRAADDVGLQTAVRLRREIDDLRRQLIDERAKIDQDRAALRAEKDAFAQMREQIARNQGSEQFKQALGTLESQKPKDAQTMLQTLIDAQQYEQAVAYLAAMQDRTRTKVMAEFVKADPKLAAELLERLRVHGVQTAAANPRAPAPPAGP